jgi:poly [ADP-ribose] polymerase
MAALGYDSKKLPLGKLSKTTIQKGYDVLQRIAAVLDGTSSETLADLSGEFYSLIPHDFGFKKMKDFVIRDQKILKLKLEMLESLVDIQIATNLMNNDQLVDMNPIDRDYQQLKCGLMHVDPTSDTFQMILGYVKATHAPTHNNYTLWILDVFEVEREGDKERFQQFESMPHRRLLWHGSRLSNWMGVLSQGLRIAPPEAPVTG